MSGPGAELLGQEEIDEVLDVLRGGRLSRYGSVEDPRFKGKVRRVEEEIARRSGVDHAVAVNSGTVALWIALAGVGIGAGDEVIVPGFTFVASISAIVYAGATPVLAEIDESLNLDPTDVASKVTNRTRAIMAVHMLGNPARLAELADIAKRHDLALIEDCAQAFGASYCGRPVGSVGVAAALSFNNFKTITCGDGGMVLTGMKLSVPTLVKRYGREAVQKMYAASLESIDCVEEIVHEENIDCFSSRCMTKGTPLSAPASRSGSGRSWGSTSA